MKKLLLRFFALCTLLTLCVSFASADVLLRAGGSFGYAIDSQGVIWGWGDNTKGQLGDGTKQRRYSPVHVASGLDGSQVADIQCGNENTVFLMKDGTVYTCGPNNYGQQGVKDAPSYVYEPIQIPTLSDIVQIACGFGQCLARTSDGHVWAWGRNNCGQIGNGTTTGAKEPVLLNLEHITDIQCGGKFCMAMDEEGNIWGWGDNESGQLLLTGKKNTKVKEPTKLSVSGQFTQIACGGSTAFGLDHEGRLWSWGKNDYWQMGTNEVGKNSSEPRQVMLPEGLHIKEIHAYNSHTAVLTEEGEVYQWGRTYSGQLGNGKRPYRSLPLKACPEDGAVEQVATGSSSTYVLLEDGIIRTSGYSAVGQTGAFHTSKGYICNWQNTGLNLITGEWIDQHNK